MQYRGHLDLAIWSSDSRCHTAAGLHPIRALRSEVLSDWRAVAKCAGPRSRPARPAKHGRKHDDSRSRIPTWWLGRRENRGQIGIHRVPLWMPRTSILSLCISICAITTSIPKASPLPICAPRPPTWLAHVTIQGVVTLTFPTLFVQDSSGGCCNPEFSGQDSAADRRSSRGHKVMRSCMTSVRCMTEC